MNHLITRKNEKLQVEGNLITGDTFAIRFFIKTYLGGKWDADNKGWRIDTVKLGDMLRRSNHIGLRIASESEIANARKYNTNNDCTNLCKRCGTYCYGDCYSH